MMPDLMEKLASLCKRRGFIFPDSEIYGGFANTWDYGPLGVELKNNLKAAWWRHFVTSRSDMVGIDTAVIMNPKAWEASGHLANFTDPLVECKSCHKRFRADHLLEAINAEPKHEKVPLPDLAKLRCPECGGELTEVRQFNLMFKTLVGPVEDAGSVAYLRPELAAGMFTNFKNVQQSLRLKLPFGIAQIGRAFRNEITTGNFIFRTREFEIAEFEYFIKPSEWQPLFEMWRGEIEKWWRDVIRVKMENLVWHDLDPKDRAFYSQRTIDVEYRYPFGTRELHGFAYRTDYDLSRHEKMSGESLRYEDPASGEKFVPHVLEPSFGVDRMILVALLEAYEEVEPRSGSRETKEKHEKEIVMRFPKALAPVKVAVLPLSKKESLGAVAEEIARTLRPQWVVQYDEIGSIGKRYRRQDEIGTPYCVTVDFESLEDKKVTVRDRDTMTQDRVAMAELVEYLREKLN
ncbi:glycine--tRNA ligase [Candidatus Uhrbacteria bacterium]|nr:glycine--tRNA ligase [Candidatus Uhrbacteria bacterium]